MLFPCLRNYLGAEILKLTWESCSSASETSLKAFTNLPSEYTRALNAAKMERMFAAPFVGQMGKGHVDGVYSISKDPNSLQRFASGSGDGIVKVWDLTSREEIWTTSAHENIVKSLAWTLDKKLLTCASDRTVKLFDPYNTPAGAAPSATWLGANAFTGISHHRSKSVFATSGGSSVSIYDLERTTAPPEILKWPTTTGKLNFAHKVLVLGMSQELGSLLPDFQGNHILIRWIDTISCVAFNQVEDSILASAATDRSIVLYDLRTSMPLAKTILNFASNKISWNPMEAMVSCSIFSMRMY